MRRQTISVRFSFPFPIHQGISGVLQLDLVPNRYAAVREANLPLPDQGRFTDLSAKDIRQMPLTEGHDGAIAHPTRLVCANLIRAGIDYHLLTLVSSTARHAVSVVLGAEATLLLADSASGAPVSASIAMTRFFGTHNQCLRVREAREPRHVHDGTLSLPRPGWLLKSHSNS